MKLNSISCRVNLSGPKHVAGWGNDTTRGL